MFIVDSSGNPVVIVGWVMSSRNPIARVGDQPVLATEEHPVLDRVESGYGHGVSEVNVPKELIGREPGAQYANVLRRYRVEGRRLIPRGK